MLTRKERENIAKRCKQLKEESYTEDYADYDDIYCSVIGEPVPKYTEEEEDIRTVLDRIIDLCDTSNMIDLPLDKDGEPIHFGDTVYNVDGIKGQVFGIFMSDTTELVRFMVDNGYESCEQPANKLTHKNPLTAKNIANRIKNVIDGICDTDYAVSELSDVIYQLGKLNDKDSK